MQSRERWASEMKFFKEDVRDKFGHQIGIDIDEPPEKNMRPIIQKPKKPAVYKDMAKGKQPQTEAADHKNEKTKTKQANAAQKVLDIVKGKKNKVNMEPTAGGEKHDKVR